MPVLPKDDSKWDAKRELQVLTVRKRDISQTIIGSYDQLTMFCGRLSY